MSYENVLTIASLQGFHNVHTYTEAAGRAEKEAKGKEVEVEEGERLRHTESFGHKPFFL